MRFIYTHTLAAYIVQSQLQSALKLQTMMARNSTVHKRAIDNALQNGQPKLVGPLPQWFTPGSPRNRKLHDIHIPIVLWPKTNMLRDGVRSTCS